MDLDLDQRFNHLPQELRDYIVDLTFSPCTISGRVDIDASSLPPSILRVDSTTRRAVAEEYYSNSTFHCNDTKACVKWLESLPKEHLYLLRSVYCEPLTTMRVKDLFNFEEDGARYYIQRYLKEAKYLFANDILKVKILPREREIVDQEAERREALGSGSSDFQAYVQHLR